MLFFLKNSNRLSLQHKDTCQLFKGEIKIKNFKNKSKSAFVTHELKAITKF